MLTFADRMHKGETIYTLWSQVGSSQLVAQFALSHFDGIVIDMQHGVHSDDTVVTSGEAIIAADKIAIVRLPVDRFDAASRALDLGYEAVIAPMINTKQDAETFAKFMKYPPIGERSWGPGRAVQQHKVKSADYLQIANQQTLAFAMIETRKAYENFDEIISTDGIDGIFVGPSDLSIDFANGAGVDPNMPETQQPMKDMAIRAKQHGKFAGIFARNPEDAPRYANWGYQFVNVSYDGALLADGCQSYLERAEISKK